MNIRSISNPAQVLGKENIESARSIKSDETADREANGQQPQGEQGESHRALTQEELEKLVEKVKAKPGISENNLQVILTHEAGQAILKIQSEDGNVIRRFVEKELYFFLFNDSDDELHLVKRTA